MPRLLTANEIINRAAVQVGLRKVSDPVGSTDDQSVQFTELLTVAGQELVELHPWQTLEGDIAVLTKEGDTGFYDLPADYAYLIDQTAWDHTNSVPVAGPLSEQDVAYLQGRNLITQSIYSAYYITGGQLALYPQPPTIGLDLRFKYIKRNWVEEAADSGVFQDEITEGDNLVYYEPIMITQYLKLKWREAKGFDTAKDALDFENMFLSRQGKDKGARVLNAGGGTQGMPYITPLRNTTDSWPWLVG